MSCIPVALVGARLCRYNHFGSPSVRKQHFAKKGISSRLRVYFVKRCASGSEPKSGTPLVQSSRQSHSANRFLQRCCKNSSVFCTQNTFLKSLSVFHTFLQVDVFRILAKRACISVKVNEFVLKVYARFSRFSWTFL